MNDTTSSHHVFPSHRSFFLDNLFRKLIESPTRVLDQLDLSKNDVVIDFGCGTGYYTIPLAQRVQKVIGIDIQGEMLKKAEKKVQKFALNIEFIESDGTQISLPDSTVSLIFLNRVFHEIDKKIVVLREFKRLLKQQGRIAIKEKTSKSLSLIGPPVIKVSDITRHLDKKEFKVVNQIKIGSETLIIARFPSHLDKITR